MTGFSLDRLWFGCIAFSLILFLGGCQTNPSQPTSEDRFKYRITKPSRVDGFDKKISGLAKDALSTLAPVKGRFDPDYRRSESKISSQLNSDISKIRNSFNKKVTESREDFNKLVRKLRENYVKEQDREKKQIKQLDGDTYKESIKKFNKDRNEYFSQLSLERKLYEDQVKEERSYFNDELRSYRSIFNEYLRDYRRERRDRERAKAEAKKKKRGAVGGQLENPNDLVVDDSVKQIIESQPPKATIELGE